MTMSYNCFRKDIVPFAGNITKYYGISLSILYLYFIYTISILYLYYTKVNTTKIQRIDKILEF